MKKVFVWSPKCYHDFRKIINAIVEILNSGKRVEITIKEVI